MFYELWRKEYEKSEHFGENILYQFKDTISGQEKQNVIIVYETGSESNLKIEYKIVDNSKYDISYLKKDF